MHPRSCGLVKGKRVRAVVQSETDPQGGACQPGERPWLPEFRRSCGFLARHTCKPPTAASPRASMTTIGQDAAGAPDGKLQQMACAVSVTVLGLAISSVAHSNALPFGATVIKSRLAFASPSSDTSQPPPVNCVPSGHGALTSRDSVKSVSDTDSVTVVQVRRAMAADA